MRASEELKDVFARLMDSFAADRRCTGFEKHKKPEARNLRELAGVLYRWFDVHFYKVLDAVTRYEMQNPDPFTSILRQSEVTVADVGAGIGTFSIALADFIFQRRSESRVQKLNFVLVEQNTLYQNYARWFFQEVERYTNIPIRIEYVSSPFPIPECLEKLVGLLENMSRDFFVVGMSNLLHWLKNPTREQAEFVLSLVEKIRPLYAVMFSIESKDNVFRSLSSALKKLYSTLAERSDFCSCLGPEGRWIRYYHFPASCFGSKNKVYGNQYLSGLVIFKSGLAAMGSRNNLMMAYFKSRMALRREFPCDEVAIKLFESRLDSDFEKCAQALKKGYTFCSRPLHYKTPKNSKEFRLRVMDNVYDSLVATAFLDLYGRRIDREFLDVSCGNRINPRRESEFIYRHFWYAWYHLFIVPILTKAPSRYKYYCHLDIDSYYPSVNQAILLDKLLALLPSKDAGLKKLVTSLISRDYHGHKQGYGLPQGPVASGFLANLYLHEVDKKMQARPNLFYMRYVDDFYLLGETEEELRKHVSNLSKYLGQLHLRLKEDKTEYGVRLELCRRYQDPALDRLDKRLKELLRRLYVVADDKEYLRACRTVPAEFLLWYTECLRELGIWLSPEWLHRKVCYQRRRFSALRALGKLLPWRKVKLPYLGNTWSSPREWVKTFRKLNPGFCALLEAIREEIETGLREAYTKYYTNYEDLANPEKNMARSRFRFYTYRASILITPGLEKILQSLVLHPWLCNLAVLRTYPSVLAETARNFRNLSPYLRSAVLWAIGETRDPGFSDFLVHALFDRNSSLVVKLMASQALLKIGGRVKLDRSQLEREIEAALSKEQTFLLKNLILLWGMFWKEAGKNKLFVEVGKKCADFPEHERWLVEQALANVTRGAEIVSSLDTIPDWLLPEEYPEYEDIPEFTPVS